MDSNDIPWEHLSEVLRSWSGRGQLYEALAAIPDSTGLQWSARDIERRARRVTFEEVCPHLVHWPVSSTTWLDALPAQSRRRSRVLPAPASGVDWTATRIRGWPPEQFVVRERTRTVDQMMTRVLRWSLDTLAMVVADAESLDSSITAMVDRQLTAALDLRGFEPLASTEGDRPDGPDIAALRVAGRPWNSLAPVADHLHRALSADLRDTARRHIAPDDKLDWRLFHLAVFGAVIAALRSQGMNLVNRRPLSGSTNSGPNYQAVHADGSVWDVWFEGSKVWSYYGWQSPYRQLLSQAHIGHSSPVRPDITIVRPGGMSIAIECKYAELDSVTRDGYHQALTYATELASRGTPQAAGIIVGPDRHFERTASISLARISISLAGPRHLRDLICALLNE